ncbi:MAG: MATE family efflux transporter [Bacillales bacterium]|jgi:putative MATE family efflux protein|nr:MATE family efflux transporter [Bacillales bacterium]
MVSKSITKDAMLNGNPLKAIFLFMIPVFISNLIASLYNMMDSVVIGQFMGPNSLAAIATTGPINFLVLGFVQGLATGFGLKIAQKYGAGNALKVRRSLATSFIVALFISLILSFICFFTVDLLLQAMNVPKEIIKDSRAYILVFYLGIITIMFNTLLFGIVRGFGNSTTPLIIGFLCSTVNVGMDLLFIGVFHLPIYFAALTNVFAQIMSSVLSYLYLYKKYPQFRTTKEDFKTSFKECWEQISMGLPMAFQFSITAIGTMIVQNAINGFGANAIAGFSVGGKTQEIVTTAMMALGVAVSTYCAQNLGAHNYKRIKIGLSQSLIIWLGVVALSSFITYFGADVFVFLFLNKEKIIQNPEIKFYAKLFATTITPFLSALSLIFILRTSLQAMNSKIIPTLGGVMELIGRVLIIYLLVPKYSVNAIAYASPLAWVFADLLLIPGMISLLYSQSKLIINYTTLNNGLKMPMIGSGTNTFGKENNDFNGELNGDNSPIMDCIANGYRLFDTAVIYRNERILGDAIKQSGFPRETFFITSKIPNQREYIETDELVEKTIQESLNALQTEYIDLYLIHHPWEDSLDMLRVYRVLEKYVELGKIKSIGVSNFSIEQLEFILKHAFIKPVINQFISHPGLWNKELIEYCLKNDIVPEAYSSLKYVNEKQIQILKTIANKHHRTWHQVLLNYQTNLGMVVIPKSHLKKHQKENFAIFNFKLDNEDQRLIAEI